MVLTFHCVDGDSGMLQSGKVGEMEFDLETAGS
jgi:hypothetical protein